MKTLKEKAKEIRGILKEKGIKASVVMRSGSAIQIYVKDLAVDYEEVRAIARSFEKIDRCEYTHEILAGGNDFVFVNYDYDVLNAEAQKYSEAADQYIEELEEGKGKYYIPVAQVGGNEFLIAPDHGGATLILNTDERQRAWTHTAHCKESLAKGLAIIDARYELEMLSSVVEL